jgi:hypothetical protein
VHYSRGQASIEYVAILLVVGAVLAVAAVAVPGVGERLVTAMRTAICTVGGDVCRGSDAAAAGLPPCVTRARVAREETSIDVAVVRLGEHGEWQLALQSDGRATVTRLEDREIGGTVGVGVTFSPAEMGASAEAAVTVAYHGGRAWRFPDAPTATAFLDGALRDRSLHDARPSDIRWHAIRGRTDATAAVAVAELARAGITTAADSTLGLRTDGSRRTLTLDLGVEDPRAFADLPGFPAGPGKQRSWIADLTWERGTVRELALRAVSSSGGRLEEFAARLDLRDPGNRAVAARLLRRPGASTSADMRALTARMRSHGVIEYSAYSVRERRRGFSIAARLGVAVGLSHRRVWSERQLVDAVAWLRGGPPQRRFDCLGGVTVRNLRSSS